MWRTVRSNEFQKSRYVVIGRSNKRQNAETNGGFNRVFDIVERGKFGACLKKTAKALGSGGGEERRGGRIKGFLNNVKKTAEFVKWGIPNSVSPHQVDTCQEAEMEPGSK